MTQIFHLYVTSDFIDFCVPNPLQELYGRGRVGEGKEVWEGGAEDEDGEAGHQQQRQHHLDNTLPARAIEPSTILTIVNKHNHQQQIADNSCHRKCLQIFLPTRRYIGKGLHYVPSALASLRTRTYHENYGGGIGSVLPNTRFAFAGRRSFD